MKREIASIIVVVLFFGLALAPSINANVSKEDDLVELDVEFCGLGRKHSVKLIQEEYDEVELIFEDIQDRLSSVESDDEAVDIFNEAIVKLDGYGLLGDVSVKQVQSLITTQYLNFKNNKYVEKFYKSNKLDDTINSFCLTSGETNVTHFFSFPAISLLLITNTLQLYLMVIIYFSPSPRDLLLIPFFIFSGIFNRNLPIVNKIFTQMNPFKLFSIVSFGTWFDSRKCSYGNIWTLGSNGIREWNGSIIGNFYLPLFIFTYRPYVTLDYYMGIVGFSGIQIKMLDNNRFLGFSIKVNIDNIDDN